MKKREDFQKEIEKALKAAGKYSKSLGLQVMTLATAMQTLELAGRDLDGLESTVIPMTNRYGSEGYAAHPVFKILKDAQDSVTRQMKALGLTAEDLSGQDENDPLIELTKKVKNAGRKAAPLKPRAEACAQGQAAPGDGCASLAAEEGQSKTEEP